MICRIRRVPRTKSPRSEIHLGTATVIRLRKLRIHRVPLVTIPPSIFGVLLATPRAISCSGSKTGRNATALAPSESVGEAVGVPRDDSVVSYGQSRTYWRVGETQV